MKKSLVAIAALTLVGAASAQVSLTGNLSFSYQTSLNGAQGIAASDNSIFLTDTEDLGGGTKLVASTGFDAGGRGVTGAGNFGGENASLAVSGGFGTVKLTQFESDGAFAAVEGLSGASLPVGLFDSDAVNNAKRFRNGVTYSAPAFSGVTLGVAYVTLANTYVSSDSNSSKTKVGVSADYANGGLKLHFDDAFFNADYPGAQAATQPTVTALYDFGVAQVGAGWTKATSSDAATTILAVSVPVGAVTLGLATSSYNGSVNGSATWTEASVGYALSKRTSLKASWGVANDSAVANANTFNSASVAAGTASNALYGTTGGLVQNCQYRVGLFHSF